MAKGIPNPEPSGNDDLLDPLESANVDLGGSHPSGLQPWTSDDILLEDRDAIGNSAYSLLQKEEQERSPLAHESNDDSCRQLHAENEELRSIVAELEREIETAVNRAGNDWAVRQSELEGMLGEKTEKVNEFHVRIQELETQIRPPTPKEEELIAMSEELERERCQIQQERGKLEDELRQLKGDSEVMTKDMQQMEVQMARERADLARQRNELQRLSEEIRHELERIERDRGLSDRMGLLKQRHMEVLRGKSMAPSRPAPSAPTQLSIDLDSETKETKKEGKTSAPTPPPPPPPPPKKKDSGMFRRLFGGGG